MIQFNFQLKLILDDLIRVSVVIFDFKLILNDLIQL